MSAVIDLINDIKQAKAQGTGYAELAEARSYQRKAQFYVDYMEAELRQRIVDKQFREDLYYRLTMIEVRVPALRERMEDLLLLTRHFINKYSLQFNKPLRQITQRAQIVLGRHSWPGNVRELENVIGQACMMTLSDVIDVPDLPPLGSTIAESAPGQQETIHANSSQSLADHEKHLVLQALERAGGNQSEAARLLRLGRDALRYKIRKHGIGGDRLGSSSVAGPMSSLFTRLRVANLFCCK